MNRSGFTLIELLIVVAIMIIINVVMVSFFITTESNARSGSESINRIALARSALNLIAKDIRTASGISSSFLGYKTSESCLILKGKQTTIVYTLQNNALERIVFSPSITTSGMKCKLIDRIETLQFKFDAHNPAQIKLVTASLSYGQDKFVDKNIYTLTAVTKLRLSRT